MKTLTGRTLTWPQRAQEAMRATAAADARVSYTEWLDAVRWAAKVNGAKAWTASGLARANKEYRDVGVDRQPYILQRKAGEIVNPMTGEIVTGCLTVGKLARKLGITTAKLTDQMVRKGLVQRVLSYREVPMVCERSFRKPDYHLTPDPLPSAVEAGLLIPIKGRWNAERSGPIRTMILVTPKGQKLLSSSQLAKDTPRKKVDVQREAIHRLYRDGRSPTAIADLTGIPRRTIFRRLADIRLVA